MGTMQARKSQGRAAERRNRYGQGQQEPQSAPQSGVTITVKKGVQIGGGRSKYATKVMQRGREPPLTGREKAISKIMGRDNLSRDGAEARLEELERARERAAQARQEEEVARLPSFQRDRYRTLRSGYTHEDALRIAREY